MSKNIQILDCTLRDGGYVNNWEFDYKTTYSIIDELQKAKIDYVELGIMGLDSSDKENVKFRNFKEIERFLLNKKEGTLYTVILNYSEKEDFDIPKRSENTVEAIRLAFFKPDWRDSIKYAKELMNKGYLVFMQAMATPLYSDNELYELTIEINKLKPFAFYIVDSFGVLYNNDITRMVEIVDKTLVEEIVFGFHGHNNIQMAFSNAITFIQTVEKHSIIVDSSVYGMGRGAGNLTTELIAQYLNRVYGMDYDMLHILKIYDEHLSLIYKELPWGYTMDYFVTSSKNINSAYGWYFMNKKGVSRVSDLNGILDNIPSDASYTLFKDIADKAKEIYDKTK